MQSRILVLADGREERVSAYAIVGDVVRLVRTDGAEASLALAEIDADRTLRANASTADALAANASEPLVEVVERVVLERGSYRVVEGVARNGGTEALGDVVACATLEGPSGVAGVGEALVERRTLGPGEETRFRVLACGPREALRVSLSFRRIDGTALRSRDASRATR